MKGLTTTLMAGALAICPVLACADELTHDERKLEAISHEEASPHSVTGNLALTSNYIFRGVSQTFDRPAVQGGFDYAHASGVYLGTWASNVSGNTYTNGSLEWDIYGGYNGKINDDLGYTVGLLEYYYPGAKTSTTPSNKYNTLEGNVGVSYKTFSLKYSRTFNNYFGVDQNNTPANFNTSASDAANGDSKGSGYWDAGANFELPQKVTLGLHLGHQKVRHYGNLDYTDYKISLGKEFAGFNFSLAYTNTNAKTAYYKFTANSETKELADSTVILSVGKTF